MEGQKKVKRKKEAFSRDPYRRPQESEILDIAWQIQSGAIIIRGACMRHGMNRNTLKKWLLRISVRRLDDNFSEEIFAEMTPDKQVAALQRKVKDLARALQTAQLKIDGLETMIQVAEQELQIKIRKKAGAKRSTK